jgi:hypothetical protein
MKKNINKITAVLLVLILTLFVPLFTPPTISTAETRSLITPTITITESVATPTLEPLPTITDTTLEPDTKTTSVQTATAAASLQIETEVNTNVVSLETEQKSETESYQNTENINITNSASLTNVVELSSNTGSNNSESTASAIITDNATTDVDIFNQVNTNLIGINWYFQVNNIFTVTNEDVVLPYEFDYINLDNPQATTFLSYQINNSADVVDSISAVSNTGNNQTIENNNQIVTGNAITNIWSKNIVNTNIIGDNWFSLQINCLGVCNDNLLTNSFIDYGGQNETKINSVNLSIENNATVKNNIQATANTGNNQITGNNNQVTSGNATTSVKILNVVNTNLVGNNWYFYMLNLYRPFQGQILFSRPDLNVSLKTNSINSKIHNTALLLLSYENTGNYKAKNVFIVLESENGKINTWQIPELSPSGKGVFSFPFSIQSTKHQLTASIFSSTHEDNLANNQSSLLLTAELNKTTNSNIEPTSSPQIPITEVINTEKAEEQTDTPVTETLMLTIPHVKNAKIALTKQKENKKVLAINDIYKAEAEKRKNNNLYFLTFITALPLIFYFINKLLHSD